GHSSRVAHYARKIAELSEKSDKECGEVYYAALLHDVGKIGTPDRILEKKGELTGEEEQVIRDHTLIGNQILSNISDYPYLSEGAYYHPERYDGKGYPNGLKGRDIPEIARIITVADAYDVMVSGDEKREPVSLEQAREELIREAGGRFDPDFARAMAHIIDVDSSYSSNEKEKIKGYSKDDVIHFDEYRSYITYGIQLTDNVIDIHLESRQDEDFDQYECVPAIILFDSTDGNVQNDADRIEELAYIEYGEIWFDGHTVSTAARNMQVNTELLDTEELRDSGDGLKKAPYEIQAVKHKDHVLIRITGNGRSTEVITALPDSTRYAYISLSGEHLSVSRISIRKTDVLIKEGYIPRIAEEISYINRMEGDIPNVQVNSYRTAATEGIPIEDGLKLLFHTMSLPSARTVWHCPLIVIFYSADSIVYGKDYREYALISLDGEKRESDGDSDNNLEVSRGDGFGGWEAWKAQNKLGYDSEVIIKRKRNRVIVRTENLGISIVNTTIINDGTKELYAALTGDQCALTDIRLI
ncbi:MAG: HD domain-containing protein, partial [Lachnospiraceae bacterium]|nr:HD domain-containing protein [Lachnospiraceae bacterium]